MQTPISQSEKELEKLSGIVKRITFHSVEKGFTVLKVNSSKHKRQVKFL